jgi:TonB family protein
MQSPTRISIMVCLAALFAPAMPQTVLHGGSIGIRQAALAAPTPKYPMRSFMDGVEGKVVVEITIIDGLITSTSVIESPDAAIAAAVETALKDWRFKLPARNGTHVNLPIVGRLIFIFVSVDGRPTVIDAAAIALADTEQNERSRQR